MASSSAIAWQTASSVRRASPGASRVVRVPLRDLDFVSAQPSDHLYIARKRAQASPRVPAESM